MLLSVNDDDTGKKSRHNRYNGLIGLDIAYVNEQTKVLHSLKIHIMIVDIM